MTQKNSIMKTREELRDEAYGYKYRLGYEQCKDDVVKLIDKMVESAKNYIEINQGHCVGCDTYCGGKKELIEKLEELKVEIHHPLCQKQNKLTKEKEINNHKI